MLKLDRTLIQGFERHKDRRAVVVAMLALAHEVGLSTVAVGIETNESACASARAELLDGAGLPAAPARRA